MLFDLFELEGIGEEILGSCVLDGIVPEDHFLFHFVYAFFKDLTQLLILNDFLFFGQPNPIVFVHLAQAVPLSLVEEVELGGELLHDDPICFCIVFMLIPTIALFFN